MKPWILLRKAENHKSEFSKGPIQMFEITKGRNYKKNKKIESNVRPKIKRSNNKKVGILTKWVTIPSFFGPHLAVFLTIFFVLLTFGLIL